MSNKRNNIPFSKTLKKTGKKTYQLCFSCSENVLDEINQLKKVYTETNKINPSTSFVIQNLIINSLKEYKEKGIIVPKPIKPIERDMY